MSHSKWYTIGIVTGVIFGIVMVLIYMVRTRKKRGKCEFDERQQLARGKAFKYGFVTAVVYFLAYSLSGIIASGNWMKNPFWVFAGVSLSIGVFAGNAIWNDGYFSLNETPDSYMALFGALAVINLIGAFRDVRENSLNLCLGVLIICILIVMGVKRLWDKKREEED